MDINSALDYLGSLLDRTGVLRGHQPTILALHPATASNLAVQAPLHEGDVDRPGDAGRVDELNEP